MVTLIMTRVLVLAIAFANALESLKKLELADGEIRDVVLKYIKNIPDIENQYVINQKLSKAISRLFKGNLSMLPLYKINLKIDRNPIKIPWTLENDDGSLNTDMKLNTIK